MEAAVRAAAETAGRVLRRRFREAVPVRVETKGMHDFVTEIDREAEAAVVGYIRSRFPDHAIMAEEGSPEAEATAAHRWIIDPLDGTTNFIHGVAPFAVSVALEDREGLLAGAVYDPVHEEMFHARRGGGAYLNGEPIRCSEPQPGQALIATGFPFRELGRLDRYMKSFEGFVRTTAGIRRAGSAAIDLAYTACGRYDGFWEIGLARWDIAAGVLLVREAGGIVTDVVGGDSLLDSGDILAAGSRLYPTMLEITRKAFG